MLTYTGHPLVDVGIATICAFVGKRDPTTLTEADLDRIAAYMADNYVVDPLKSFLTVAFPNSGFTQPAYKDQPEKRALYAERVLRAYRSNTPRTDERCVFTGQPAAAVAFDLKDALPAGRAYRQHVPLVTGEDIINFHPYGDAGLPLSGLAMLALHALPLGCAKVAGRLLAVHSDDPRITYSFALRFLERNRKNILMAQQSGDKKLPEPEHRVGTFLVGTLLELQQEHQMAEAGRSPASITAYHFTNSGQGVDLAMYHVPMEITRFLGLVTDARHRDAWGKVCARGWEIVKAKKAGGADDGAKPRYNVLYEDLLRLPDEAARFIRCYLLRTPERRTWPGDPRATYSLRDEADLVSWKLTELFLKEVVHMNAQRIQHLREVGDRFASYIREENDRRFFHLFMTARRYDDFRAAIIRVNIARLKRGQPPVIAFDPYVEAFEYGSELPYDDWRLGRDLVLIRMIERLFESGWLRVHADALALVPTDEETAQQ